MNVLRTLVLGLLALGRESSVAAPDFASEVRPVLTEHCANCHGPEKQTGKLRLDMPGKPGRHPIRPINVSKPCAPDTAWARSISMTLRVTR